MGSARPSKPRKEAKTAKARLNPAPRLELDHATMPISIMCRAPNRSINQPAAGHMQAQQMVKTFTKRAYPLSSRLNSDFGVGLRMETIRQSK